MRQVVRDGGVGGPGDDEVEVIRDGAALLLRLGTVLVRVRPAAGAPVAEREVRLASVLGGCGVPVTALVAGIDQPWTEDGCVVTAWRWTATGVPTDAAAPGAGPADIGALARTLRERTAGAPSLSVPPADPIGAILEVVAHRPADDPDAAFVRHRAAELADRWSDAASDDPLGRAIVHGDLHAGNVVAGPDGPLLTDLELAGAGPSTYDAAPAAVAVARYGADPSTLAEFLAGFGADPTSWAGFETFVAVYELWVTAWAVGVGHQDPVWGAEATRRVATLRDGLDERWTLR